MTQSQVPNLPGPLLARILAAFVDSLVIQALLLAVHALYPAVEYQWIASIGFCLLYFGVGNSHISGGTTLGKRAFGLQVVHSITSEPLSLAQSIKRSVFHSILAQLVIEVPSIFFRQYGVTGSPYLLDTPMLLVLVYSFWNYSLPLANDFRRAGHDFLASSIVISRRDTDAREEHAQTTKAQTRNRNYLTLQLPLSICIAFLAWIGSTTQPPLVEKVQFARYLLERDFPVRITGLHQVPTDQSDAPQTLDLQLLATRTMNAAEQLASITNFCKVIRSASLLGENPVRLRIEIIDVTQSSQAAAPLEMYFEFQANSCADPKTTKDLV